MDEPIIINLDDLYSNDFSRYAKIKPPKQPSKAETAEWKHEYMQKYRQNCKTIECYCSGRYKSYYTKSTHFTTTKHINFINSLN